MSKNIVIIGGGIIGCTTAYYLSRHPSFSSQTSITIIEASAHGPAQGASGKAGGLVARWAYPKELVDVSFDEHVKLAEKHNGAERWGWRYVNCGRWEGRGNLRPNIQESGVGKVGSKKSLEKTLGLDNGKKRKGITRTKTGLPDDLSWVEEELTDSYIPMAGDGETAQVHPYLFTTSMWELAQAKGVILLKGKATLILKTSGAVTGVEYVDIDTQETKTISATHVILAAGAWSTFLLPSLPLTGTRAHSITIRPKAGVVISPYVLFTEITLPASSGVRRTTVDPEIYARPDGEVYACGPGDDSPLPESVDDVVVDEAACKRVHIHVSSISQELSDGDVERRQACFLPSVTVRGGPIIGEAQQIAKGLVIATGHTCWGICNAPATARVISEIIMSDQVQCVDLTEMQPSKFLQRGNKI